MKVSYLVIFIFLCSFQCSRWVKYADHLAVKIEPQRLTVLNDSVTVNAQVSLDRQFSNKVDSLAVKFYYLTPGYENGGLKAVGEMMLRPSINSNQPESVKFNFPYEKGKKLYGKQIVWKKQNMIESPLLIVAEH